MPPEWVRAHRIAIDVRCMNGVDDDPDPMEQEEHAKQGTWLGDKGRVKPNIRPGRI